MNLNFFKGQLKFFILKALNKKPVHGYLLMKEISENCFGLWKPTAGSLYPALEELKNEKLIEIKTESKTGRKKKVYEITAEGRKKFRQFSEKSEEMEKNICKIMKDPELSKYSQEDTLFLLNAIHSSLIGELEKYKSTLLEFAMLARNERIPKGKMIEARKAFKEFLERINKINSEVSQN